MRLHVAVVLMFLFLYGASLGQDSSVTVGNKVVVLKEVIVRSNLNAARFIQRVQDDSTFYKAFKNLRILGYSSLNDIRMFGKKERVIASLQSETRQTVARGCRSMRTISETTTGDMYSKDGSLNYYTAELYASLFFTKDTICGETNTVGNIALSNKGKSGIEKHKEQLKMLFFNPGKKIPGIPFIGDKIAIFENASDLYDFEIDMQELKGEMCYVFRAVPRADLRRREKDRIVINEMTTWFNIENWDILARNYSLSYRAGVYDFDVDIQVELGHFNNLLVPTLMKYNGNWDVVFKKRERAVFTATLFNFTSD